MPRAAGTVISAGLATMHELQSVYGTRDLYDLLEIAMVDAFNRMKLQEAADRGR